VSQTNAYHRAGDLLFGSWPRTIAVLLLALLLFAAVAWAAISGSFANPGTWNIPGIHPYPPQGTYLNPLSTGQRELVDAKAAAQVRKDFLNDGQLEVDAFARGDAALLSTGEVGQALAKAQQLIASNNSDGVYEHAQNRIDNVVVGLLPDPNQPDVRWCVRETGTSTISFVNKASGTILREQKVRFDSKYWLVRVGNRYLITDRQIVTQSAAG